VSAAGGLSETSARASLAVVGSRWLFWLLVAAFAYPARVDFAVGPFTTISVLDLALMVCAGSLGMRFLALGAVRAGPLTLAIAVLAPPFMALASLLWAVNAALTAATTIKYFYAALMYFVALQLGEHLRFEDFARACVAILLSWLLGSLAMYLGVPGFAYFIAQSAEVSEGESVHVFASLYSRLGHPYIGQSNDYGPLLVLLGFVLLGFARVKAERWLIGASALAFLSSVLTVSRSLILTLVLALSLYALLARVPLKRVIAVALAAVLGAGMLAYLGGKVSLTIHGEEVDLAQIAEDRLSDETILARAEGYRETLGLVADRPWLGYGAGYFDPTYPDALIAAHNAFLEQWKYFGTVLGTLSIACYLAIAVYMLRMRRAWHGRRFYDAIACAWVFLLLNALVQTFFEATVPRAFIFFILGLCAHAALRPSTGQHAGPVR